MLTRTAVAATSPRIKSGAPRAASFSDGARRFFPARYNAEHSLRASLPVTFDYKNNTHAACASAFGYNVMLIIGRYWMFNQDLPSDEEDESLAAGECNPHSCCPCTPTGHTYYRICTPSPRLWPFFKRDSTLRETQQGRRGEAHY